MIAIALDDIRGDLGLDLRKDARRNGEAVARIRKAVIDAKIALSSQPSAKIDVDLPGGNRYQREISLEGFEQMIQPIIDRIVDAHVATPCGPHELPQACRAYL